ncbi:hypothetical protein SLEP1_g60535, partial [Rubroshorea leprosula]
TGNSVINGD